MERIKLVFDKCNYVVKENDGVVVALITAHIDKYVKGVDRYVMENIKVTGVARCHRDTLMKLLARNLQELRQKEVLILKLEIFFMMSLEILIRV